MNFQKKSVRNTEKKLKVTEKWLNDSSLISWREAWYDRQALDVMVPTDQRSPFLFQTSGFG